MSEEPKKRKLPASIVKMKERKMRKLNGGVQSVQTPVTPAPQIGDIVKVNDLKWTEITPPDQLDDYSGFYGLEEIEGVDVVKDALSDRVSFKHVGTQKMPGKAKNKRGAVKNEQNNTKSKQHSEVLTQDGEKEEWEGVDEDKGKKNTNQSTKKPVDAMKSDATTERKQKKQKKNKSAKVSRKNDGSNNATFDLLAQANEDDEVDVTSWRLLQLSDDILSCLSKLKFSSPTPIQEASIPTILSGHDLIGKAPTGSGKTLAFGIPIVEQWLSQRLDHGHSNGTTTYKIMALIVLPTRELAQQITKHLEALCSQPGLDEMSIVTLTGGLSIQKQKRQLSTADVLVATPGRLWEVISEVPGTLDSLKNIKYLVVDEADRLLSEGHFKELEQVLNALDRKVIDTAAETSSNQTSNDKDSSPRQTLVFSATFSKTLRQKLTRKTHKTSDRVSDQASMEYLLRKLNFHEPQPHFVDVNPVSQMAANLQEGILECPKGAQKDLYLYALLLLHNPRTTRALVFANSISAVRRLVPLLQNLALNAHALHSGMPQKARLRSIERFTAGVSAASGTDGAGTVLVATDVAARGLDIPDVHLVVHYNVPRSADAYVHRSGRTARADRGGASVLLCGPDEAASVRRIVAQVHASAGDEKRKDRFYLRSVDVEGQILGRIRPRVTLAKKLADAAGAKEKKRSDESWMRPYAEELGVDMDSAEFRQSEEVGKRKKNKGRSDREKEARGMSKAEMKAARAELKSLLEQRVNTGVSARYLAGGGALGGVDVDELLRGEGRQDFLGKVDELGLRS